MIECALCWFLVTSVVFATARPSGPLWGYVVPGLIFAVAFAVTWALYRRFAGGKRGK